MSLAVPTGSGAFRTPFPDETSVVLNPAPVADSKDSTGIEPDMEVGPAPFSDFRRISPPRRNLRGPRESDLFLILLMMVLILAFETAVGIGALLNARSLLPAAARHAMNEACTAECGQVSC